jgi:hypothetical protein
MSPIERVLAVADDKTLELARRLVGRENLALFIAKQIANGIGGKVDVAVVAEVFDIETKAAYNKISKIQVLK